MLTSIFGWNKFFLSTPELETNELTWTYLFGFLIGGKCSFSTAKFSGLRNYSLEINFWKLVQLLKNEKNV